MKTFLAYACLLAIPALNGCSLASSRGVTINIAARAHAIEVNRAYKADYFDKHEFVSALESLDVLQNNAVPFYHSVTVDVDANRVLHYMWPTRDNLYSSKLVGEMPWQKSGRLYTYVAVVQVIEDSREPQLASIVCKADAVGSIVAIPLPVLQSDRLVCADFTTEVN